MSEFFVSQTIRRLARKIGAQVIIEPEYGFVGCIVFKNGARSYFRGARLDINPQGAAAIAQDKAYTSFFLDRLGYSTPKGQTFFSDELCHLLSVGRNLQEGYQFARSMGLPVIVKPNDLAQGKLVAKVHNKREYLSVARRILRETQVLLVQRVHHGRDYRVVVLDDEIVAAYERVPLSVLGDGSSTISELLENRRQNLVKRNRKLRIDLDDVRVNRRLRRKNLSPRAVLPSGTKLFLLDNANLSEGGEAVDFTKSIHPSYRALAVEVTKAMGLRFCGVDILTGDLGQPLNNEQRNYVILETNASPGLENYAAIGTKQARRVDELYLDILRKLETEYL